MTHSAVHVRADGSEPFYMNHLYLGTAPGVSGVPGEEWRVALLDLLWITVSSFGTLVAGGSGGAPLPRSRLITAAGVRPWPALARITRPG